MTTLKRPALAKLWDHIKLSLNDPQWGRKPGASGTPTPPSDGDKVDGKPGDRPADTPRPAEPPRPSNNGGNGGNNGGGRGNKPDGPPDLDELLKKVNDKVSSLFGGKGGGRNSRGGSGGPQMPAFNPKLAAGGAVLISGIAATLWLATGFYQVDDRERGIVQRFGKYLDTTQPGLNWHIPWPVDSVTKVRLTDVRNVEIGYKGTQKNRDARQSQMLTEDLNIIDITFAVQYTVSDAKAFLFNHRKPDEAVVQAAETAMREVVGKHKMDFLLNQGREKIAQDAQKLMQDILTRYGTGILISRLNLQGAAAPDAVSEAFQDVVKAQQDGERVRNEAQAYANRVVPVAKGEASRLIEQATGYQQSVESRAEGDASRFKSVVAEYNKAPGVTRERLYIDMMQSVLGNSSKVLVDQRSGGQNMLYLPLDKLMSNSRESTGSITSPDSVKPPAEVAAPPTAAPARESTRVGREARN
jgi:modulator of FtsH protease HflK